MLALEKHWQSFAKYSPSKALILSSTHCSEKDFDPKMPTATGLHTAFRIPRTHVNLK